MENTPEMRERAIVGHQRHYLIAILSSVVISLVSTFYPTYITEQAENVIFSAKCLFFLVGLALKSSKSNFGRCNSNGLLLQQLLEGSPGGHLPFERLLSLPA